MTPLLYSCDETVSVCEAVWQRVLDGDHSLPIRVFLALLWARQWYSSLDGLQRHAHVIPVCLHVEQKVKNEHLQRMVRDSSDKVNIHRCVYDVQSSVISLQSHTPVVS
jgi:hypothetical protein